MSFCLFSVTVCIYQEAAGHPPYSPETQKDAAVKLGDLVMNHKWLCNRYGSILEVMKKNGKIITVLNV